MSISKMVEDKLKEEAQNRASSFWEDGIKNVASNVLLCIEHFDSKNAGFKALIDDVETEVKCSCDGGEVPTHETPLPIIEYFQEQVAEEFVNKSVTRKKRKQSKKICSFYKDKNRDGEDYDEDDYEDDYDFMSKDELHQLCRSRGISSTTDGKKLTSMIGQHKLIMALEKYDIENGD